ncbi:nuclear transport factor 2 family protein [Maricaulis sp. CAU 1757]
MDDPVGRSAPVTANGPVPAPPPNFEFDVVRVLTDGSATFIHAIHEPESEGDVWLTMSLVRVGKGGRMRVRRQVTSRFRTGDCLCLALAAAKHPMGDPADSEANREVIRNFAREVGVEGRLDLTDKYVDLDVFVSHTPGSCCRPERLDDLIARRRPREGLVYHGIEDLVAQGNFVALFTCFDENGQTFRACDLFRMYGGRVVEHWDVVEQVESHTVAHNDDD